MNWKLTNNKYNIYKKTAILLAALLLTSFNSLESNVYICVSKGAKKQHYSKNCRGLSNCKHEIRKVTLEEAQNNGLDFCGWED